MAIYKIGFIQYIAPRKEKNLNLYIVDALTLINSQNNQESNNNGHSDSVCRRLWYFYGEETSTLNYADFQQIKYYNTVDKSQGKLIEEDNIRSSSYRP